MPAHGPPKLRSPKLQATPDDLLAGLRRSKLARAAHFPFSILRSRKFLQILTSTCLRFYKHGQLVETMRVGSQSFQFVRDNPGTRKFLRPKAVKMEEPDYGSD